jgi:hypothetical protein
MGNIEELQQKANKAIKRLEDALQDLDQIYNNKTGEELKLKSESTTSSLKKQFVKQPQIPPVLQEDKHDNCLNQQHNTPSIARSDELFAEQHSMPSEIQSDPINKLELNTSKLKSPSIANMRAKPILHLQEKVIDISDEQITETQNNTKSDDTKNIEDNLENIENTENKISVKKTLSHTKQKKNTNAFREVFLLGEEEDDTLQNQDDNQILDNNVVHNITNTLTNLQKTIKKHNEG